MTDIMTVHGPVPVSSLGHVLPHEHVFENIMLKQNVNGLLHDPVLMAEELRRFAAAGGTTIVDVTPAELAHGSTPDPAGLLAGQPDVDDRHTRPLSNVVALERISQATGVTLVLGTGHYRDPFIDRDWFNRNSVQRIGQFMVDDIERGFPGSDVHAGIIGEIGADQWYISAAEERSFRAAAYAHRHTGATITTHTSRFPVGLAQLSLLMSEGVDPRAVIIGHSDTVLADGYHLEIAKQGAYVQLDMFYECFRDGSVVQYELERRVRLIMELLRAGHHDRILLSHDIGLRTSLAANGGSGYLFVGTLLKERLLAEGLPEADVDHMLVTNPQRALVGVRE